MRVGGGGTGGGGGDTTFTPPPPALCICSHLSDGARESGDSRGEANTGCVLQCEPDCRLQCTMDPRLGLLILLAAATCSWRFQCGQILCYILDIQLTPHRAQCPGSRPGWRGCPRRGSSPGTTSTPGSRSSAHTTRSAPPSPRPPRTCCAW